MIAGRALQLADRGPETRQITLDQGRQGAHYHQAREVGCQVRGERRQGLESGDLRRAVHAAAQPVVDQENAPSLGKRQTADDRRRRITVAPPAVEQYAALLEGVEAVFAEVPGGVKDAAIRKLGALARTRRAVLYLRPLRGSLPSGVAQLSLESQAVSWDGADRGHGSIAVRRSVVTASGKSMRGTTRTIEMEDDGTDAVLVVSRVGAAQPRVATG